MCLGPPIRLVTSTCCGHKLSRHLYLSSRSNYSPLRYPLGGPLANRRAVRVCRGDSIIGLSMRLVILCLALCQLTDGTICNQGTQFECLCDKCADNTEAHDPIDWLYIQLVDCPPKTLNELTFRKKIASWINEECGASLDCHLNKELEANNIVIGDFSCERKEIALLVLRNSTASIDTGNAVSASIVGLVLQSREHLLSFLLHSELINVAIQRRFGGISSVRKRSLKFWMVFVSVVFLIFLILLALSFYFSQIYINWRRIVKGKWQSKEYHKVPNVRYSVDEITSQGHI